MGQRSVRFPDELEARAEAQARAEDRSFSYVVVRALEKALATEGGGGSPGVSHPVLPASSRAPEVEALREIADASVPSEGKGSALPKIAPRHWAR